MTRTSVTGSIARARHTWTLRRITPLYIVWTNSYSLLVLPLQSLHLLYEDELGLETLFFILKTVKLKQVFLIDLVRYAEQVLGLHLLKVFKLLVYWVLVVEIGWTLRHLMHHLLWLKVERWLLHGWHLRWKCWILIGWWKHTSTWLHRLSIVSLGSGWVVKEMRSHDCWSWFIGRLY